MHHSWRKSAWNDLTLLGDMNLPMFQNHLKIIKSKFNPLSNPFVQTIYTSTKAVHPGGYPQVFYHGASVQARTWAWRCGRSGQRFPPGRHRRIIESCSILQSKSTVWPWKSCIFGGNSSSQPRIGRSMLVGMVMNHQPAMRIWWHSMLCNYSWLLLIINDYSWLWIAIHRLLMGINGI